MSACDTQMTDTVPLLDEKRPSSIGSAIKKVLFVTNTNEYGGVEKHVVELVSRLQGPGVQISIICFCADLYSERLASYSEHVNVLTVEKAPVSLKDWVKFFRSYQPEVLVLVYGWIWCFPSVISVAAWLAGIRRRISIQHLVFPAKVTSLVAETWKERRSASGLVTRMFGKELPWITEMFDILPLSVRASLHGPRRLKISAYASNTTICVSRSLQKTLVKEFGFPVRRTRTIHNGVSLSKFFPFEAEGVKIREKLGVRPDEFLLVCTARLSEQKGIDLLLEAMAQVLREGIRCKCLIIGDGPLKEKLMEQSIHLGLSSSVSFEGFQEDVRPYLHASSAFILTSHREGLPLSILEAMACGLPSIVTDVGGNTEAITNEKHGLVVPPGSVEAIASAISYLATHPNECAEMSKNARARACEEFDIEKGMGEIKRLILGR
jgi:glycosyltransferase involved in cell wall biosynthesis